MRPARGSPSEPLVAHHAVDQPPFERLGGRQALAQHRQLTRPRHPDPRRQEQRGAAVGDEADVDEGQQEVGALGGHDQIAAQRQRAADADGGAVDGGEHRLGQLADRVHDRVVALGQRLVHVGSSVGGRVDAEVLQVGPRGEGPPAPVITTARTSSSSPARRSGAQQVCAELPVPGVQTPRAGRARSVPRPAQPACRPSRANVCAAHRSPLLVCCRPQPWPTSLAPGASGCVVGGGSSGAGRPTRWLQASPVAIPVSVPNSLWRYSSGLPGALSACSTSPTAIR